MSTQGQKPQKGQREESQNWEESGEYSGGVQGRPAMASQGQGDESPGKWTSNEPVRSEGVNVDSHITRYLESVDFPANKQKIVEMARSGGAPETILQLLNKLPDKQYNRSSNIEQEFSKMR
jgi:hypothetical protein